MSNRQSTKLIFAGLDKAGKTTIYKATMEEMTSQELEDLKPTRGIERHDHDFLDKDFSVWDLGGQQNYREAYLEKPEVFNQTKAMIFVVDIQDMDRINESYQYFTDILNILKNVDPAPNLYVLFHKYDPEIAGKLKSHFYKAARLFRKADALTKQKFKFYLTSIYSNSIDLAVKRILFENFDDFEEPSERLVTTPKTKVVEEEKVPMPGESKSRGEATKTSDATPLVPSADGSKGPPIPSVARADGNRGPPMPSHTPDAVASTPKPSSSAPIPSSSSAPAPRTSSSTATAPSPKSEIPQTTKSKESAIVREPKEEKEQVSEDELSEQEAIEQATPSDLIDLSDSVVNQLTEIVNRRMKESVEIVALSIISTAGDQILAIGKEADDYEKLDTLKEVVSSLNPKQFFKNLTDIEYRGLGHFSLSDFDIYFARVSDEYAIALIAEDVSTLMLQNAQRIVRSIRQGLGIIPKDDDDDDSGTKESGKKSTKKDLVTDLRSRLKSLSGLGDLN